VVSGKERREEIRKVKKPEKMKMETLLLNIGATKKVNSEIISPGSFPEGVTPEKPKHVPVNPILCQLMF